MPTLRAARGARIILVGPLPRYMVGRCCSVSSHITNYDGDDYVKHISNTLKEVGIQLKNMLQTRRIKSAKLVNPAVLMGLRTTPRPTPDKMIEIWGLDSVHANKEGYSNIACCVLEELKTVNVVFARKPSCSATSTGSNQGVSTTREERAGQPPRRKLRTGKIAGITHAEEESRGEEATEAAEGATEDEEGKVPAVVDTVADPTKKRKVQTTLQNVYLLFLFFCFVAYRLFIYKYL